MKSLLVVRSALLVPPPAYNGGVRRSAVLLVLVVVAAFGGAGGFLYRHIQRGRTWAELRKLSGQELFRESATAERAARLFDRHLGPDPDVATWPDAAPLFVLNAQSSVIVIQCWTTNPMGGDGTHGGTVHVFDLEGRLRSRAPFSFGWPSMAMMVTVRPDRQLNRDVIDFTCGACAPFDRDHVVHQFYALNGDRLDLLRLEGASKEALPNHYLHRSAGSQDIAGRMEGALFSEDAAEVLPSLVWLGGKHWRPPEVPGSRPPASHDQAARIVRLRQDPRVRARVAEGAASPNAWIREAAALAASSMDLSVK